MRNQFSVELGKCLPPRSGDAAEDRNISKWPYFFQLSFLRDTVKPRASNGNLFRNEKLTAEARRDEDSLSSGCDTQVHEHREEETITIKNNKVISPSADNAITPIENIPVLKKKCRPIDA